MKRAFTLLAVLGLFCQPLWATKTLEKVYVLNEGSYDYVNSAQIEYPKLGEYDPITGNYSVVEELTDARWASQVIVDGNTLYVAADTLLIQYDRATGDRVNTTTVHGIRKMVVWEDQLLVSRGDQTTFNSYFQAYNKNTLAMVYELDSVNGPQYASESMIVDGDVLYLAINNGYDLGNQVGQIGVIDLVAQSFDNTIELGNDARNPENLMMDGDKLYTFNNKITWDGSTITSIDLNNNNTVSTVDLALTAGCGTSVMASNWIYYQEFGSSNISRFDFATMTFEDSIASKSGFYGIAEDAQNDVIYASVTDYFSYGRVYIMDYNGAISDSFEVSLSPGSITMAYSQSSSVKEANENTVRIFPNPAKDVVNVYSSIDATIEVNNMLGQTLKTVNAVAGQRISIDISKLAPGSYMISQQGAKPEILIVN